MQPTTWVEISAQALAHNIRIYKQLLGSSTYACVVKSNAYGHGIIQIAQLLEQNQYVDYLCTVSLSEALFLRKNNVQKQIVVLSIIDENLEEVVGKNISLVVYDLSCAQQLNEIGKKYNTTIPIHLKIDTGLSRVGILYTHALNFINIITQFSYLKIEGIFSHFANVENTDQTFTQVQRDRFDALITTLKEKNIIVPYQHISCSAAVTLHSQNHYNFVRSGIGMYGLWPSPENKKISQERYPHFDLKPILTWKTRIIQLKEIPAQSSVGYDLTYITNRPTKIGLLPIGYWDGYDRGLSNKGVVIIHGKKAPVIGRVAMNLTMIDCTDIEQACVGSEVLLLGPYEGITADDIAQILGTINYEIVTRINPLLPRIIVP